MRFPVSLHKTESKEAYYEKTIIHVPCYANAF